MTLISALQTKTGQGSRVATTSRQFSCMSLSLAVRTVLESHYPNILSALEFDDISRPCANEH